MGLWGRHIEPRLVDLACGSPVIEYYRRRLVPRAAGEVLEIGLGSGLNLPFYDPDRVSVLHALEPGEGIRRLAGARLARAPVAPDIITAGAEAIPLPDRSIDTVLVTFTLCTIPDLEAALSEILRVLKPEGRLLAAEHGLAPDPGVAKWQNRLQPFWGPLAGGCHLNRDAPAALKEAGFALTALEQGYAPKTPKFGGFISVIEARSGG